MAIDLTSLVGKTYSDPTTEFWFGYQDSPRPAVLSSDRKTFAVDTGGFSNASAATSYTISAATTSTITLTFTDDDSFDGTYKVVGANSYALLLQANISGQPNGSYYLITPSSALNYFAEYPQLTFDAAFATDSTPYTAPSENAPAPCFVSGTRLAGEHGDVAVEDVRVGDRLRTADGGVAGVIWTGRRSLRPAAHPMPAKVTPIRIAADAFAPGVPARDLLLSPDHAVFANGVLIPVAALVNDATIHPVERARVTYHHIETEAHTAILAENLPTETYLDTGNRRAFEGPGEMLHPDFAGTADGFAPRRTAGPDVQAVRAQLVARVAALGWTVAQDTAVTVLADSVALTPRDGGYDLAGSLEVRIVSAAAVPANVTAGTDERRLGVALDLLTLDGHDMLRSDTLVRGWHAAEAGWRWTDGEAIVPLPEGTARLTLRVAAAAPVWTAKAARAA